MAAPRVFLTDFGLARDTTTGSKFTRTGTTLGTPSYMSPEQARGEFAELAPASDVWALGCVAYELLSGGRRAFDGDSPAAVIASVIGGRPAPLVGHSRDVSRLVEACLDKPGRHRPADAGKVRDDCARLLRGETPRARPAGGAPWWVWPVGAAAVAAGAVLLWPGGPTGPLPTPPNANDSAAAVAEQRAVAAWAKRSEDPRWAAAELAAALRIVPERAEWRVQRGLLCWTLSQFPDARSEWTAALIGPKAHAQRARLYLGLEALFRQGGTGPERAEARAHFEPLRTAPGTPGVVARAGWFMTAGDWKAARSELAGAAGWEVALVRASIEADTRDGDLEIALASYQLAAREGVFIRWTLVNQGEVRRRLGDRAGALADYTRFLELEPDHSLGLTNRSMVYAELGRYEEALADAERSVALHPDDPESHLQLSKVLHLFGRDGDVRAALERVLALDPGHLYAHIGLAGRDLREGRPEVARKKLERILQDQPNHHEVLYTLAQCYTELGWFAEALERFSAAAANGGELANCLTGRGRVFAEMGRDAEALAEYARAIEVSPDYDYPYFQRGLLRYRRREYALAAADYDRALAHNPRNADASLNRGVEYLRAGQTETALEFFDRALGLRPRFAQAWLMRSHALVRLDRMEEAIAALERCVEVAPGFWAGSFTLGHRLFQSRRWAEALPPIRRALELTRDPERVEQLRTWLAECERQLALQSRGDD